MEIDLGDQSVIILGRDGPLVGSIAAALSHCGATVEIRDAAETDPAATVTGSGPARTLDVLVFISPTLSQGPGKAELDLSPSWGAGNLELLMRASVDRLAATKGRIVVVGSVLGLLPSRRHPLGGIADGALFHLVREAAMRLGSSKVRVNGLALGAIASPPGPTLLAGDEAFVSHAGVKRPGTIEDVTNAVLFLADPTNTYMTGHILTVDGGWSAGFARDF